MATSDAFIDYILDKLDSVKDVRVKKMFGDVCLYCGDVPVGLLCDNKLYLKETEGALPDSRLKVERSSPYEGAKGYLLIGETGDKEILTSFFMDTLKNLPKKSVKAKAYDFKKEQKRFYRPGKRPVLVDVPAMKFVAVRGEGDPNDPDGAYQEAMEVLYGISFTLRMSKKAGHDIDGYFEYVVPPLEGLWWQEENDGDLDFERKDNFKWVSMIRLPNFITEEDFEWAKAEAERKKKKDFSKAKFYTYSEGLCVQCEHVGPYDNEGETIERLKDFAFKKGYRPDCNRERYHHEIYLSDPRRCKPENLRTVIRIPVVEA